MTCPSNGASKKGFLKTDVFFSGVLHWNYTCDAGGLEVVFSLSVLSIHCQSCMRPCLAGPWTCQNKKGALREKACDTGSRSSFVTSLTHSSLRPYSHHKHQVLLPPSERDLTDQLFCLHLWNPCGCKQGGGRVTLEGTQRGELVGGEELWHGWRAHLLVGSI